MAKRASLLGELPKRVQKVRARAEKVFESAWKQALEVMPVSSRKTVKDVTAKIERRAADFQRRGERALKEISARRDRFVATVEKRAVEVVKPLVVRLDVASRSDVERLSRRIGQLERRLHVKSVKESVAA